MEMVAKTTNMVNDLGQNQKLYLQTRLWVGYDLSSGLFLQVIERSLFWWGPYGERALWPSVAGVLLPGCLQYILNAVNALLQDDDGEDD